MRIQSSNTHISNAAQSIHNIPRAPSAKKSASLVTSTGTQQNELLKALSHVELERLFEHLELVELYVGQHLFECGEKINYAYFPTNAIVSLVDIMEDGASTEIAMIGREGVVGMAFYDAERASCSAIVQGHGYAYRLKAALLRDMCYQGGALTQLLMRYSSAMFAQIAQNVVGGRHCNIEQKLCHWVLARLDRSISNELQVTQEAMANMLGVRRESVTVAACKLQEKGWIEYRRGTMIVLNRRELEIAAGTCYQAAKVGYERLKASSHN